MADSGYDVAISFLVRDTNIAQALRDKLSEGLNVFFFPHTQEELAGTDGLETMREPFLSSRINVVLYREQWGNTPWTRVEAFAIRDACLDDGFESIFFFMVEDTSVLPRWLPKTHIRFNHMDYPLERAVGAIQARVQQRGGHFEPMTPSKKAELLRAQRSYEFDKDQMRSHDGITRVLVQVNSVLAEIKRQCELVSEPNGLEIECEINPDLACVMRSGSVGMVVRWEQQYRNVLDNKSALCVEEYRGRLLLQGEMGRFMPVNPPKRIGRTQYLPNLSIAREYGWTMAGEASFLSSASLGEKCVLQFMELIGGRSVDTDFDLDVHWPT